MLRKPVEEMHVAHCIDCASSREGAVVSIGVSQWLIHFYFCYVFVVEVVTLISVYK